MHVIEIHTSSIFGLFELRRAVAKTLKRKIRRPRPRKSRARDLLCFARG